MPANLENSAVPQEWKRSVFIRIPKKGSVKEHSNFSTVALISHTSKVMLKALQEGRPLPGPKSGLLSNTQKCIVWGNKCADKANDFIGKAPGWRAVGTGTQENCSATVFCFLVMGLASGLFLASHSDSQLQIALTKSIASDWTTKAFAICLYGDWKPCCYSYGLSTTPEGVQGGVRHSVLQGIWWDRFLDSWMFLQTNFMLSALASPHI